MSGTTTMILAKLAELGRERVRVHQRPQASDRHLDAAIAWLRAAQDATEDGGVSHSYLVGKGWMRSYPETTGYIIPTLLNYARATGSTEDELRALRMADWEIDIQLDSGAVADLVAGQPTVFDTGQVIFGWIAAYRLGQNRKYLDAALSGGRWLLSELDDEGVWRHPGDSGGPGRVYNARVAWALLELGRESGTEEFVAPARRFLEWTLTQETTPGWFDRNCLTTDSEPLLHTIAYTARGQLESAILLADTRFLESARRTARALAERVRPDGHLAGRFDRNWHPTVKWACLTGIAQTSIIWRRLAGLDDTARAEAERFEEASERLNAYLCRLQDLTCSDPGRFGGIRGSFPLNGAYGKWRVLNWATKFFVDALLVQRDPKALWYRG